MSRYLIYIFRQSLVVIGMIILLPLAGVAQTVTLNPVKDNTLYDSPSGALSNGAGIHLFAGTTNNSLRRRAVLAFNVSQIPAGSTITVSA